MDNFGLLSKKVASQISPAQNIVLDNNNINNINSKLNKHDTFTSNDTNNTETQSLTLIFII